MQPRIAPLRSVILVLAFFAITHPSVAAAQDRVALVIGNGNYRNVAALPNPTNDASDVAASLGRLGFSITKVQNAGFDIMRRALLEFGRRARDAEMAVVFFAGHGMEIGGENWLIPVDAELKSDIDAEHEAIGLRSVTLSVSGASKLGLVIMDACRINPFAAKMQRTARVRAVERGLARVEPAGSVLVAYASRDGTTAKDGSGRNSPFTVALLRHVETPGLEISFLFRHIRDDVMAATSREQEPYVYGSLSREAIYLKAAVAGVPQQPQSTRPVQPAVGIFSQRAAKPLSPDEERALTAGSIFKECDLCPEMVVIPAGSFMMGSPGDPKQSENSETSGGLFGNWNKQDEERPQHRVTIGKAFAIGKFEVTIDQFTAFIKGSGYDAESKCFVLSLPKKKDQKEDWEEKSGASWRNPGYAQTGSHPVTCINWHDAKAYVAWLSRTTGKQYRLLTEAEWEYAARAGAKSAFHFGDDATLLCAYGNGRDRAANESWGKPLPSSEQPSTKPYESCGDGFAHSAPVGSFSANAFGLYDMHGNVWEQVEDCWNKNYQGAPVDGSAWLTGDCGLRTRRGGSFYLPAEILTSSYRFSGKRSADRVDDVGFRVARSLIR